MTEIEDVRASARKDAYFWLIMVVTVIFAAAGSILISVGVNHRSIERERAARQATERAFCGIIILLDDSYSKTPPATAAGRELARAVSNARAVNHCSPTPGE